MNAQEALNTLIATINQAEFRGTLEIINMIGNRAEEARKVLEAAIKPVENNV